MQNEKQLQEFEDTHKTKQVEKPKEKEESVFMTLSKFQISKT